MSAAISSTKDFEFITVVDLLDKNKHKDYIKLKNFRLIFSINQQVHNGYRIRISEKSSDSKAAGHYYRRIRTKVKVTIGIFTIGITVYCI